MNADMDCVRTLFAEALDLPVEQRARFLERRCGPDKDLREKVERLLEADSAAGPRFLEGPGVDVQANAPSSPPPPEGPGRLIGDYELLAEIGEGGMAVVWLAQQTEPVRRQVALKILKPGMDSRQVLARFDLERDVLALLDHTHVARVIDAGMTDQGRPYFVMEHVEGLPLTRLCDERRLTTVDRLQLFLQVCDAVQHAHQKGVIHRDIKPDNILVTLQDGKAVVKVIDFGIAKATTGELTDRTVFTEQGQLIGTPEYMSPEQAELTGRGIDTRTDIYSLGVLLYELLTGVLPFDPAELRAKSPSEILRTIQHVEPPRPSTRLQLLQRAALGAKAAPAADEPAGPENAVAQSRTTDPRTLMRELRGDLDWIVMKAMDKDRSRRYAAVSELAADIRRHLAHEPVLASPPGVRYRLGKFVRRNRALAGAAGSVAVVLVLATIGMGVLASWALREADRANSTASDLGQVADFHQQQLANLHAARMGVRLRRDLIERRRTALELAGLDDTEIQRGLLDFETSLEGVNFTDVAKESLDENIFEAALQGIEARFAEQPLVQAQLLQSVANALRRLELEDRAAAPQEQALEIRKRELGDAHIDTLRSFASAGNQYIHEGRYEEAEASLRWAAETARSELGPEHSLTLRATNKLGLLLDWRGEYAESAQCWGEVVEIGGRVLGEEARLVMSAMGSLAFALERMGKHDEAEAMIRECLQRRRRVLGNEDRSTLWAASSVGRHLMRRGKLEEAEQYKREVADGYRKIYGNESNETLWAMRTLARLLRMKGELEEAERLGAEALARGRGLWPNERPPAGGKFLIDHGRTLAALKRFKQAEAELLEALAMFEHPGGPITNRPWFERYSSELTEGFAELYEAWHAAEPDAGHDARATEVQARIQAAHAAHMDGSDLPARTSGG